MTYDFDRMKLRDRIAEYVRARGKHKRRLLLHVYAQIENDGRALREAIEFLERQADALESVRAAVKVGGVLIDLTLVNELSNRHVAKQLRALRERFFPVEAPSEEKGL